MTSVKVDADNVVLRLGRMPIAVGTADGAFEPVSPTDVYLMEHSTEFNPARLFPAEMISFLVQLRPVQAVSSDPDYRVFVEEVVRDLLDKEELVHRIREAVAAGVELRVEDVEVSWPDAADQPRITLSYRPHLAGSDEEALAKAAAIAADTIRKHYVLAAKKHKALEKKIANAPRAEISDSDLADRIRRKLAR